MKPTRAVLCALLLSLLLFSCANAEDAQPLSLAVPSPQEAVIAPGRDFYVIAKAAPEIAPDIVGASVALLDAAGNALREAHSGAADFKTDYELLNAYNTESDAWLMPDLLWDAALPESFTWPWNKCYFKDGYIVALITGGVYQDYIVHRNEDGTPFAALTDGDYALRVDVTLADGRSLSRRFPIALGSSSDKVMSRFAPAAHLYEVMAEADARGYRTFQDPFPAYWSPSMIFAGEAENPYFAEIRSKWRFADAMEYERGTIHFYLYNVSPTSATQCCEMACAQLSGAVADGRMRVYGYDMGEPALRYIDGDGAERVLSGAFTPFEAGNPLRVARAETLAESRDDNAVNVWQSARMAVDTDLTDGVAAQSGQFLAFAGAAAPIQNGPEDVIPLGENAYQTVNRVTALAYEFVKAGAVVMRAERDVGLLRELAEGWKAESIYEFYHVFELTDPLAGEMTVRVRALDAHGAPVPGAAAELALTVAP